MCADRGERAAAGHIREVGARCARFWIRCPPFANGGAGASGESPPLYLLRIGALTWWPGARAGLLFAPLRECGRRLRFRLL